MITRLPILRDKKGRFTRGWHLSTKGYPRYHVQPFRNQYVHRVQASIMLGRALKKDEDVHHKNGVVTDFKRRNLQVLGHTQHGYVSALQHYYVATVIEERERVWYNEYYEAEEQAVPF
ncbi:MAG: HNH endonuclease [Minisyncoccia bacterium]